MASNEVTCRWSEPTLHRLVQKIQTKVDLVKESILMSNFQDDVDCKKLFAVVHQSLRDLQVAMTFVQTKIKQERKALDQLKDLDSRYKHFTSRLIYVQNNLPEHLPTRKCEMRPPPVVPVSQPLPQKSMTTKSNSSKRNMPAPTIEFLTAEEFNAVPSYMKGRITYPVINKAVVEFNKALAYKYRILKTPLNKQNIKIKKKIIEYKEQECKESDGYFFVVNKDISENTNLKLDNTGRNCLTILRHCGKIKEVRSKQLLRYCVCPEPY